jgi:hypothetical protein
MERGAHLGKYFEGCDSGTDVLWLFFPANPLSRLDAGQTR